MVVCQDQQVLTQTGADLPQLMSQLLQARALAWPASPSARFFKANFKPTAWVIPDSLYFTFEGACLPNWGPHDIDAECRLEASARMQLAPDQLALDYKVHQSAHGGLQVTVWAYEQSKLTSRSLQMKNLGFDLQVFTAQSQVAGLAGFFRHSFKSQQDLQVRMSEQMASFLSQGEVPC